MSDGDHATDGAVSSGAGEAVAAAGGPFPGGSGSRPCSPGPVLPAPTPSGGGIRDVFDDIGRSVTSFLENHPGVANVKFEERAGGAQSELIAWERVSCALRLALRERRITPFQLRASVAGSRHHTHVLAYF